MTQTKRQWMGRAVLGGLIGMAAVALFAYGWNGLTAGGALAPHGHWAVVGEEMAVRLGSRATALALELALAFALGAAVGVSTLPFDRTGRALALRSALHFLFTGALALLLFWACGWVPGAPALGLWFGLYTFIYLVVWLARWVGWRAELNDIRARLGLAAEGRSLFGWRENLPHILLLCALFLLLRPLAEVLDDIAVPLLRALVLPWLAYPFTALAVGIAAGEKNGFSLLVPLAAGIAFLPNLLWPNVPYHWWQAAVYALCTLLGEAVGGAWHWARRKWGADG